MGICPSKDQLICCGDLCVLKYTSIFFLVRDQNTNTCLKQRLASRRESNTRYYRSPKNISNLGPIHLYSLEALVVHKCNSFLITHPTRSKHTLQTTSMQTTTDYTQRLSPNKELVYTILQITYSYPQRTPFMATTRLTNIYKSKIINNTSKML